MISLTADAQELEPRAINNLPLGTNFAIVGYNYAQGNLLLDPALPIEDLNSTIHSGLLGYVRSIRFFDLSAKRPITTPVPIKARLVYVKALLNSNVISPVNRLY